MAGPELVIGLVGPIGTELKIVAESLQRALADVDYHARQIRLSQLLHHFDRFATLASIRDREKYYDQHMNAGNELRVEVGHDALAVMAVAQIRVRREESHSTVDQRTKDSPDSNGHPDPADIPAPRTAYIVNSLKNPKEVETLRNIYGDGFLLLAAYASRETRRDTLAGEIAKSQNKEIDQCLHVAERLIDRDEEEHVKSGQAVRKTFYQADAFIDTTDKTRIDGATRRFVSIVFGHPFETPSHDELGVAYAFTSALRSADLSRQVGAAICSDDGQVFAVGTNEVPKARGGLYWSSDDADYRDFRFVDRDEPNDEMRRVILSDLLKQLHESELIPESFAQDAFIDKAADALRDSRLWDITEYGRAVHAEMAAITDAARRGVSLQGSTLYCTTFPCHNCAKHIVAAGINRVVYIEPYPKSQVRRLFSDSVAVDRRPKPHQVEFNSFVGIAPSRFHDFFKLTRRRDDDRHLVTWDTIKKTALPRTAGQPEAYLPRELDRIHTFHENLATKKIQMTSKGGPA
ncbi:MAG TPA: anti-phage dCTP deaminase [Thermoanaerobaculia bacterium]|nr:anti-phage dCTP deaminase [Thermoanaerobaculia bacterium]